MNPMKRSGFAVCVLALAITLPCLKGEGLDSLIAEYRADQTDLHAVRDVPGSLADLKREDELSSQWLKRLDDLHYDDLSSSARIDWHLLRTSLAESRRDF